MKTVLKIILLQIQKSLKKSIKFRILFLPLLVLKFWACSSANQPAQIEKTESQPQPVTTPDIPIISRLSFQLCGIKYAFNSNHCRLQTMNLWGKVTSSDITLKQYFIDGDKKQPLVVVLVSGKQFQCVADFSSPESVDGSLVIARGEIFNINNSPSIYELNIEQVPITDTQNLVSNYNSKGVNPTLSINSACPTFELLKSRLKLSENSLK